MNPHLLGYKIHRPPPLHAPLPTTAVPTPPTNTLQTTQPHYNPYPSYDPSSPDSLQFTMEEVPYTSPRQLLVVEEGRYGSGSARQLLVVEEGRYGSGEEKGEAERFLEGLEEVEEEEGDAATGSWLCAALDASSRRAILVALDGLRRGSAMPNSTPACREELPALIGKVEEHLYEAVESRAIYSDVRTLLDRTRVSLSSVKKPATDSAVAAAAAAADPERRTQSLAVRVASSVKTWKQGRLRAASVAVANTAEGTSEHGAAVDAAKKERAALAAEEMGFTLAAAEAMEQERAAAAALAAAKATKKEKERATAAAALAAAEAKKKEKEHVAVLVEQERDWRSGDDADGRRTSKDDIRSWLRRKPNASPEWVEKTVPKMELEFYMAAGSFQIYSDTSTLQERMASYLSHNRPAEVQVVKSPIVEIPAKPFTYSSRSNALAMLRVAIESNGSANTVTPYATPYATPFASPFGSSLATPQPSPPASTHTMARQAVIAKINTLLKLFKPNLQNVRAVAKHLEEKLFADAVDIEMHCDESTLEDRVAACARTMEGGSPREPLTKLLAGAPSIPLLDGPFLGEPLKKLPASAFPFIHRELPKKPSPPAAGPATLVPDKRRSVFPDGWTHRRTPDAATRFCIAEPGGREFSIATDARAFMKSEECDLETKMRARVAAQLPDADPTGWQCEITAKGSFRYYDPNSEWYCSSVHDVIKAIEAAMKEKAEKKREAEKITACEDATEGGDWKCGKYERCLWWSDCEMCTHCLDMPKFGGINKLKRRCKMIACLQMEKREDSPTKVEELSCAGCRKALSGKPYASDSISHTCTDRPFCKGRCANGSRCNRTQHGALEYSKRHSAQATQGELADETDGPSVAADSGSDSGSDSDSDCCDAPLRDVTDRMVVSREWPGLMDEGWRFKKGAGPLSDFFIVDPSGAVYKSDAKYCDSLHNRGRTVQELELFGNDKMDRRLRMLPAPSCAAVAPAKEKKSKNGGKKEGGKEKGEEEKRGGKKRLVSAEVTEEDAVVKKKQRVEELKEFQECVVCVDERKNCLFLPCKQVACCEGCVEKGVKECPVCRSEVENVIRGLNY